MAWRATLGIQNDKFITEPFINKGYHSSVLAVLNNVRIYMKVVVLSNITVKSGTTMASWELRSEINRDYRWDWPHRRVPTKQNLQVWRDYIRGTFVVGLDKV